MVSTFVIYSKCIEYLHTTADIVGHSGARAANGGFLTGQTALVTPENSHHPRPHALQSARPGVICLTFVTNQPPRRQLRIGS